MTHITILELMGLFIASVLFYAFIKTIIEDIKNK